MFHQFGLSCGYDAILRGLRLVSSTWVLERYVLTSYSNLSPRATAKTAMKVLAERTHNQRFFISYDNLNFYKHVRDQRSHNRAHQVNYTAGYILFMNGDKHRPVASIDHASCLDVTSNDLLPNKESEEYNTQAAEFNIGKTLKQYCHNAMACQKDRNGSAIYTLFNPPLISLRACEERADYMTFPTLDNDEASIDGTIGVLKEILKLLDLKPLDVEGKMIMLNGDYLTVRNVTRTIFRRQEHSQTIHNFSCFEPIAGLFHLQMNAMKMLMHAFEGSQTDPGSLVRFTALLRRKSVGKDVKDFHGCNEFFNHVFDRHILAVMMKETRTPTLAALQTWIRTNNWPKKIHELSAHYGPVLAVEKERCKVFDAIQAEVDERIHTANEEREELKRACANERRQTGKKNVERLPTIDWKKEEARLLKELSAEVWDTVWQNARLLTIAGLVYRDFSDACRNGYSGRVEKCVESCMLMFQVSSSQIKELRMDSDKYC